MQNNESQPIVVKYRDNTESKTAPANRTISLLSEWRAGFQALKIMKNFGKI